MRKIIFIFLVLISFTSRAQTKDTLQGENYISPMIGLFTGSGTIAQRTTIDIEFGRQWDVFSLGLDIGKNHIEKVSGSDTNWYVEIRPSLNVFQQGRFTNTLTIGLGYIFNAQQNILTEFTTGIEYTPSKTWSYNAFFGTYFYSGTNSSGSQNFLGFSVMYYFKESHKKGLFNRKG
jgi:hypothetical protein